VSVAVRELVAATATKLFDTHCTQEVMEQTWSPELWRVLVKAELTSESEVPELAEVIRVAAQHAAPIPVGEDTFLSRRLCAAAGIPAPPGLLTAAEFVSGRAEQVPFARFATGIVACSSAGIALIDPALCQITPGANMAGEPRDRVIAPTVVPQGPPPELLQWGALLRSIQMSGALERVMQLTVQHASEREQFGRPLRRFQAVEHQLATMAGEVAAAAAVSRAAVDDPQTWKIAAAKIRCGKAAGRCADMAHQIHGAIGFTDEHVLHHFTLRLWSWRDEFGTEEEWAGIVAENVGPDLWPQVTR
jgi:acyl-CoA dehydrogenase